MISKLNSSNLIHGAIWDAAGLAVGVEKQACSPRCIVSTPDTAHAQQLVDDYDAGRQIDIPQKSIMQSYQRLMTVCKTLQCGRITGGVI